MGKGEDAQTHQAALQIAKSLQQLTATTQQIANCLGFLTIRFSHYRKKPKQEGMQFLHSLGFDRHAIAAILDSTPGAVSARLSELRSPKKRKESAAEGNQGNEAN